MNRTRHQCARDRQIRTLLGLWNVASHDIGALDHATGRMSHRDGWDRGQVLHAVGWMCRRNGLGSSLFARPSGLLSAHPWILVDDLDPRAKNRISEHHPPAAFVETRPGCWQAWVRLEQAVGTDARCKVASWLAHTYSTNPRGATASPFGRLPGFTNRHPAWRQDDGRAPFSRLTDVHAEHVMEFDSLPAGVRPVQGVAPSPESVHEMLPDGPIRHTRAGDRDFAIACRLSEIGQDAAAIAAVLQAVKRDDEPHPSDYIERTIAAARRRVTMRGDTGISA